MHTISSYRLPLGRTIAKKPVIRYSAQSVRFGADEKQPLKADSPFYHWVVKPSPGFLVKMENWEPYIPAAFTNFVAQIANQFKAVREPGGNIFSTQSASDQSADGKREITAGIRGDKQEFFIRVIDDGMARLTEVGDAKLTHQIDFSGDNYVMSKLMGAKSRKQISIPIKSIPFGDPLVIEERNPQEQITYRYEIKRDESQGDAIVYNGFKL